MMTGNKKAFHSTGDDIAELPAENETSKNKIGSYDEEWLE